MAVRRWIAASAIAGMAVVFACSFTGFDWYAWGRAEPPDRSDVVSDDGDVHLETFMWNGVNAVEVEPSIHANQRVRFGGSLKLDPASWRQSFSPSQQRQDLRHAPNHARQQQDLPRAVVVIEAACKSSKLPGERVAWRWVSSLGMAGLNDNEFGGEFPGISRPGTYRIRVFVEARHREKFKASIRGQSLLHSFDLHVDQGM